MSISGKGNFAHGSTGNPLTSIVRNRIATGESTFACFLDMRKAFDWVNSDLLMHKLLTYNIDGKIYRAINQLYKDTESCVRLNNELIRWFATSSGVRKGDVLSPTLFNIYSNDLAVELNNLGKGVIVGETCLLPDLC
jgi:hypothetical protein